jgi:hypothetical protein
MKRKTCENSECEKRPSFGTESKKPRFCALHKQDGMKNVVHKLCKFPDCTLIPSFGTEWKKPRLCNSHKVEGMENVVTERCEHSGCKRQPSFGTEWKKPRLCNSHKEEGMENVVTERCEQSGCKRQPSFGTEWRKPRFCNTHKEEGMENVTGQRCEHSGCKSHPCFGTERKKPRFCNTHKKEGMENVVTERCEHSGCKRQPSFGTEWMKPRFCNTHKEEGMEDVTHKRCKNEWCGTRVNSEKYRGYCLPCFAEEFPLEKVSRNYKTKERLVTTRIQEYLEENCSHLTLIADRQVDGGCSRRRPDVRIECFTHSVIIETDEYGHDSDEYCSCENKRMMELMQDLGTRPIVFIRINPDSYTNSKGEKIPSPFSTTKATGLVQVKRKKEWEERLRVLVDRVAHHVNTIPEQEVTVEHLYYNGFH